MAYKLKITPLIKGLITGVAMVATSLILDSAGLSKYRSIQYLFYLLYAGGIAWTLLGYYRSPAYKAEFGSIFGQGFRCFIIITLVSVIFTWISVSSQPEIAEKAAVQYRADLVKEGGRTPAEIDKMVSGAKENFVTGQVSLAIFGSLITGAIFTAAGAGLLLMRRK